MSSLLNSKKTSAVLGLLLLLSAFAVVYSTYSARLAFIKWQSLLSDAQKLDVEWGRLLIEKSSSSSYVRLEKVARQRLGMSVPSGERLVVLSEGSL